MRIAINSFYTFKAIITTISCVSKEIPVDLNRVQACSPAIVQSWFNGTEGGNALADILIGKISPSGRLPFSYPFKLEDSPAYATGSFPQTDAPVNQDVFVSLVQKDDKAEEMLKGATGRGTALYAEDLLVGYRWFDTKEKPVMYPFGYGLGYSEIEYSYLGGISFLETEKGKVLEIKVKITNKGKYDQYDVPQLYVHRVDPKVEWPYKELKAFTKVLVPAGETVVATMHLPVESLKYWDEEAHDWKMDATEFDVMLCRDAGTVVNKAVLTLKNL